MTAGGRLLWGAASRGGWPIRPIPAEWCRDEDSETPTLVLMGNRDFVTPHEYVEAELMPKLRNGRLVVPSEMGHMEVATLQPEAFGHAVTRFLDEGVVDSSRYRPNRIDFTPSERLGDEARAGFQPRTDAAPRAHVL